MMPRHRLQLLALFACAIAALLLLASGLSTLTFRPGRLYDLRGLLALSFGSGAALTVDPTSAAFWQSLLGLIWLALLLFTVVALIVSGRLRRELLRRIVLTAVAVLLLYLFVGLLRNIMPPVEGAPPSSAVAAPAEGTFEPLPAFDPRPSPWLVVGISVLLAGLLLLGIWLIWRRARPRPAPVARLADEAQAALADIQAGGDLADTVLRCYRDMSRVLADERGITRPQATTPREFERQLATAGLRDEHIRQLTRLFERVRYGARHADEREKEAAVACLTAIVQTYGRAP
jgi:hypothetical protein